MFTPRLGEWLVGLLVFALAALSGAVAVRPHDEAAATYTFDWPTQPYLSDNYGEYAYRDMGFQWWGCSSPWCWFGNFWQYTAIVAPTYQYDTYGFMFKDTLPFPPFDGGALPPLTYGNTPVWKYSAYSSRDLNGTVQMQAAECSGQWCAAPAGYIAADNLLWAQVTSGSTSAACVQQSYPYEPYC